MCKEVVARVTSWRADSPTLERSRDLNLMDYTRIEDKNEVGMMMNSRTERKL
jgi:hypothetical protein